MPEFDITAPDGTKYRVSGPPGSTKQQALEKVKAEHTAPPAAKAPTDGQPTSVVDKYLGQPVRAELGAVEGAANMVTGGIGAAAGGITGSIAGAVGGIEAGRSVQDATYQALTYQPQTKAGQQAAGVLSAPGRGLDYLAKLAGRGVEALGGGPGAISITEALTQAAPVLASGGEAAGILRRGGAGVAEAAATATPEALARNYAGSVGLDWDSLPSKVRGAVEEIAKNAGDLTQLDPKAIERQAKLERLGIPATRGQVMRDLTQLTGEENIRKSQLGAGIRKIDAEQDVKLHEHLDTLRGATGAKAETRSAIGESAKGALSAKYKSLKGDYDAAYAAAREKGATQAPIDIGPLKKWLQNPTNRRNAPYLTQAIKDYTIKQGQAAGEISINSSPEEIAAYVAEKEANGTVSINDLEEIRKEATANTKKSGPEAHFAKEAVKVMDGILDSEGLPPLYKAARAKYKAAATEFDKNTRVGMLVKNKGMTKEQAVAVEDTVDHVLGSSAEEIGKIKTSLTSGGSAKTRRMGTQGWADIKGGVITRLKEAASKAENLGEDEQIEFGAGFRNVYRELKKDGKIDAIFDPKEVAQLDKIYDAVGIVRTKPKGGVAGSDTVSRLTMMLSRVEQMPGITGLGRWGAGKLKQATEEMTAKGKAREAVQSPLESAATYAKQTAASSKRKTKLGDITRSTTKAATLGQVARDNE